MPHTTRHRISGCNPVRRQPAVPRLLQPKERADEIRREPAGGRRPNLPAPALAPSAAASRPASAVGSA